MSHGSARPVRLAIGNSIGARPVSSIASIVFSATFPPLARHENWD